MARARNIKPKFFKNDDLADLGPLAQLLFAGLWCLADREGRLEDKPRFIKAEIFPYYDCDINGELTKLTQGKFVSRYSVDGVAVIEVCNFKKHQTPHNTEKASTLPPPPANNPIESKTFTDNGGLTVNPPKSNDGKTPDSRILNPESLFVPPVGEKPKREKSKCRLPENFAPNDAGRGLAQQNGLNLAVELEKFKNHHTANGSLMADWQAAFRTWCGNAPRFAPKTFPDKNAPAAVSTIWHESAAGVRARAAELDVQERDLEAFPTFKARVMAADRQGATA